MTDERRRRERAAQSGNGWSPAGIALSLVLHGLAIGLIFLAPHPIQPAPPTAYTVELVDPSAVGGKLLAGPIGGGPARPVPPPPREPPPPPPPPPPEPPPDQLAKNEEPPPAPEDEDDEAMPLATRQPTPVTTATPRVVPTARPTALPTAHPTARPTARTTATVVASPKPKSTATPYIVVAKNPSPAVTAPPHRAPSAVPTSRAEAPPKAPANDLDDRLTAAIKGVEAKVEKSGTHGGVPGAPGTGGGQGGTERSLDGPAGVGGEGRGGGGTVRGLEFVVYYNQMLNRIKERWTWVGTRADLRVTVQFSILPSGEITNIRLVERSGDQSYDSSVERAVKGAGPLPPPPEAYRTDFGSVELTFRPADLQRPPG